MDRIIDIFGKRKNREFFIQPEHVLMYFVIYWVKKIGSITLTVF